MESPLSFRCIEVTQPIGTFYIGSLDNATLQKISWADVRRIEGENREVEIISGLQRKLSSKRVDEIAKYVTTKDATFPTSIILAIAEKDVEFDEDKSIMYVRNDVDVAKVIDGQHRIKGLNSYRDPFQLNVAIFVEMEAQDQAIVFSTINLTQTKVSKSLVYDLFELVEVRSPQKTAHNIARAAHYSRESPFEGRIKILGQARNKQEELLTQAGFVEPIIKLISTDPLRDGDDLKRDKRLRPITEQEIRGTHLVFRNLFIENQDAVIGKTIFNYFRAVAEKWPGAWNLKEVGNILPRTNGYRAFMNVLPYIVLEFGLNREITKSEFHSVLERTSLEDKDFRTEAFLPGTSGERGLTNRLLNNLRYRSSL